MNIDLQRFRATFLEEAAEHLAALEQCLLELEAGNGSADLLDRIFRAVHSVKGGCGIFGFAEVSRFAHELETVLDRVRAGALPASRELVDLLLRSGDHLRVLLDSAAADAPATADAALLAALSGFTAAPVAMTASTPAAGDVVPGASALYHLTVRPHADLLRTGLDAFLLLRDLAALGALDATAHLDALPALEELDPESCCLHWTLTLRTSASEQEVRDVFAFVEDLCDVSIRTQPADADVALTAASPPAATGSARPAPRELGSLRVSTDKLDGLVNLVGELIISQAMANQVLGNFTIADLPLLLEAMDALDRNIRELQDRVLAVRMVPLGDLFSRFPRVVRDLAHAHDKQIDLVIRGEETELDKGVVEQIADPLTHLIRNAIDHGVETAAARAASGKPARATVTLAAATEAGNVVIEVADDGRGLDREAILEKALRTGLIAPDVALGDAEIDALIFHPGFSTAAAVTDISGRGVGMDVVRRNIEALGGAVTLESVRGRGTTFRIRLPLTLAILDGMQIRVGAQVFVLPLHSVIESFRPAPADVQTVLGRGEVARVRGDTLPLIRLDQALGVDGAVQDPTRGLLTVVEQKSRRFALLCDEVIGQSQIVIKNLEANYRRVDGVLGATILGDGRVALILDLASLTTRALEDHGRPLRALA